MKNLFFKQNNFIEKNNFSKALKKEIRKMFHEYFKDYYKVPLDFKVFDKEISDLVIKLSEEQEQKRKEERKRIRTFKCTSVKTSWKGQKFIK